MRAFYGSRISAHMTRTPEGYLICHDVPIARTGEQEYAADELPPGVAPEGGVVTVTRAPEDVLSGAVIASFEGKPVTSPHPAGGTVGPSDWAALARGHVQHVRRGTGEREGYILADLVISDASLIAKIEGGLREVSCGYDCGYERDGSGRIRQVDIRGNHVAVVPKGRAGGTVAIQDAERSHSMNRQTKVPILARMLQTFARDAQPEEVAEAMTALSPAQDDPFAAILEALEAIKADIAALRQPARDDDLEALEERLAGGETPCAGASGEDEGSATLSEPGDDGEERAAPASDSAGMLRLIRAIRPAVAALPDKHRKSVSDALIRALKPGGGGGTGYARIAGAREANARGMTADAGAPDLAAVARAYAGRNPHANKR